ncbi:uncharacterized protein LOC133800005 [Humulus lupulus]|uniref:uncharacterized protein LOC133800005 n=1 Tax=Humulus lupulus TaxID=3486 RepID=UPI002B40CB73|nr:uncharacterized protein LOC133800005 [Humulus lupulus]
MAAASNPNTGERPLSQIPKEQTPHAKDFPCWPGKQPMVDPDPEERLAEAKKCNGELARQVANAQAPPQRPRGRPHGSTAARRVKQVPSPASQPTQPRSQRSNWAKAIANPTAKVPAETGNNRTPTAAQNLNPKSDRANSGPSRPDNGRQPLSPIRHPPSPIRHPSPFQEVLRTAHQRPSRSGSRDGNRLARPG